MREIALDTETTGLDPKSGHRVIEIGCVEMMGRIRTGKIFHTYLNPERTVPLEATQIHGITSEFLHDKPAFADQADRFLEFISGATLVIHNAPFDLKFLNHELGLLGKPGIESEGVVDTVRIAREKFPGAPASLDALCKRFMIDLSSRTKHGALLDAELLADMYLELMGGNQHVFGLSNTKATEETATVAKLSQIPARAHSPSEAELEDHNAFLAKIKNPMWTS